MSDLVVEPWRRQQPPAAPLWPPTPTPPPPDAITAAISDRADSIAIERMLQKKGIPVNRLTEKLAQAAGVAQRQTAKIEARADALIAREATIAQKTDAAFEPHEEILASTETALDALEASLKLMTNGGDPLLGSGG